MEAEDHLQKEAEDHLRKEAEEHHRKEAEDHHRKEAEDHHRKEAEDHLRNIVAQGNFRNGGGRPPPKGGRTRRPPPKYRCLREFQESLLIGFSVFGLFGYILWLLPIVNHPENEIRAVRQIAEKRNDMQELQSTIKTITATTFPPTRATSPHLTTTTTTTPLPTTTTTTTPLPTTTTTNTPPPTTTTTTTPLPTTTATITPPPTTTTTATLKPTTTTTTTPPPTTTTTTTSPPTTTTTTTPPPTATTTTTPPPTATTTNTPPPTTTTTTTPPPTTTTTTTPPPTTTTTTTPPPTTTTTATTTTPSTTITTTTTPPPWLLDCSGGSGRWITGDGHGVGNIENGPHESTGRTNCFERCLLQSQTTHPEVNGATYRPADTKCYCETRMIGIDIEDPNYETCIFKEVVIPPYYANCTYLPGVGYGIQNSETQPQPTFMRDGEHCSEICLVYQLDESLYQNANAAKFNPTNGQCRCQDDVLVIGNHPDLSNWETCIFKEPPVTYADCGNWSNTSVNVTSNSQGVLENYMYSRHDCYVLCDKIHQAKNYVGVMYDGSECWCLKTNTLASSPSNSTQICYWP